MFPRQTELDSIITNARAIRNMFPMSDEIALIKSCESVLSVYQDYRSCRQSGALGTLSEKADIAGVAHDILNGYVSPSVGNVREYSLTLM